MKNFLLAFMALIAICLSACSKASTEVSRIDLANAMYSSDVVMIKMDQPYSVATVPLQAPAVTPQASPPSSGLSFNQDVFYNFRTRTMAAVVSTQVGKLTDILGHKNWNVDTSTFAGMDTKSHVLGGIAATVSKKVADQLYGFIGFGLVISDGSKAEGGLRFGFSFVK